jgi:GntR family transcriptional regulator, rspAB operon transcriptional repressor
MASLKNTVYLQLKERIISGLLPCEQRIEEKTLAVSLQMSRTPVREAIHTLAQEGWITIIPRKGIFVRSLSLQEINDIFQVRKSIEPLIIQDTFCTLDKPSLACLKDQFSSLLQVEPTLSQRLELDRLDNEFHLLLMGNYSNQFIHKMMCHVYEHSRRLRGQSRQTAARYHRTTLEHIAIIDAIFNDNLEQTIECITLHNTHAQTGFFTEGTFS